MRVKFSVEQKIVYRANASAKIEHRTLCKVVGDPIAPDFEGIVTSPVTIPTDTIYNIHNCEIINVEHYIKVCNVAFFNLLVGERSTQLAWWVSKLCFCIKLKPSILFPASNEINKGQTSYYYMIKEVIFMVL